MFYFKLMFWVGVILFGLSLIMLILRHYRRNEFYYPFQDDKLLNTKKENGYKNYIYITKGETSKYIGKYVVCISAYQNNLICNFTDHFKKITYYVVEYSRNNKALRVLEVTEKSTAFNSRIINLSKQCYRVNVFVKNCNDVEVNGIIIKPLPITYVRRYSFFSSMIYLSLCMIVDYLAPLFALKEKAIAFCMSELNLFLLLGAVVLFLLHWLITFMKLKKKNLDNRTGGIIEYDFY